MPPSGSVPRCADPAKQIAALMLAQGWLRARMKAVVRVASLNPCRGEKLYVPLDRIDLTA